MLIPQKVEQPNFPITSPSTKSAALGVTRLVDLAVAAAIKNSRVQRSVCMF